MRVLQLIQQPQFRGAEIFACQLSLELVKSGIQSDVAYLFIGKQNLILRFPQLNFIDLKANRAIRFYDFKTYRNLKDLIEVGGYDIVQANAGDTLKYAAISKLLFRWKAKLIFRNANKLSDFVRNRFHASLTRFFLRQCDFIISVSENSRQDICSVFPLAINRSIVASIGTYDFHSVQAAHRDTQELVWINIGSFVPEKNHEFLLEIFAAFFGKSQKGYLWLVGDGKLKTILERKIEVLGLKGRVIFWGYQLDLIPLLKASDLLVLPSKIEGLPGVILEAFSSGVPVVASSVGGIPEVVKNGITGICLEEFDVSEYLRSINQLLENKSFREQLVSNASKMVLSEYNMEKISGKFINCYQKLLTNN